LIAILLQDNPNDLKLTAKSQFKPTEVVFLLRICCPFFISGYLVLNLRFAA